MKYAQKFCFFQVIPWFQRFAASILSVTMCRVEHTMSSGQCFYFHHRQILFLNSKQNHFFITWTWREKIWSYTCNSWTLYLFCRTNPSVIFAYNCMRAVYCLTEEPGFCLLPSISRYSWQSAFFSAIGIFLGIWYFLGRYFCCRTTGISLSLFLAV